MTDKIRELIAKSEILADQAANLGAFDLAAHHRDVLAALRDAAQPEMSVEHSLTAMQDQDATGSVFALFRVGTALQSRVIDTHEIRDGVCHDIEIGEFLNRISGAELVVFDGGNKFGDAWKVIYHPLTGSCRFLLETEDIRQAS